ncbi:MAG: hypothetical protein MJ085_02370 [Clostridia bacterium]|nr:hypothetical protein [Clostridia bacterium]
MIWQLLLCALAAAGLLMLLWIAIGTLLLPVRLKGGCILLPVEENADRLEHHVRACAWLIESGLIRSTVILADTQHDPQVTMLAKRLCESYCWAIWLPAEKLTDYLKSERT